MAAFDALPFDSATRSPALAVERLTPLLVTQRLWRRGGTVYLTLIVKATFRLVLGGRVEPIETEPFVRRENALFDVETAPHLPSAGVIISGSARAPAKSVAREMTVRASIRKPSSDASESGVVWEKAILVVGNRGAPDEIADVFDEIPLIDELAVGGPSVEENPAGVPMGGNGPQANILPLDGSPSFVGFGPVSRDRPSRRRLLGAVSFDVGVSPTVVPDELDWSYFHVAPRDQQLGYLAGDEWIWLEGFDATSPRIESRLAGAVARARLRRSVRGPCEEIDLRADSLQIDADAKTCSICWRGHFPVAFEFLAEAKAVVGLESQGAPLTWPEGFTLATVTRTAEPEPRRSSSVPPPSSGRLLRETKVLAADELAEVLQRADTPFRPSGLTESDPRSLRMTLPLSAPPAPRIPEVYPPATPPPLLGPSIMGAPASALPPPRPARLDPPASERVGPPSVPPPRAPPSVRPIPEPSPSSAERLQVKPSAKRTEVLTRIQEGRSLEGMNLSGVDLSGVDFAGACLRNASFDEARLVSSLFQDVDLSGASLDGADLADADFSGSNLERASLRRAILARTHLERTKLGDCIFDEARAEGTTFRGATGARTSFSHTHLADCDLTGIQIERADFTGASLVEVVLSDAKLERARFDGATLQRVTLDGARLPSSKWFGAKLEDCTSRQSSFSRAHLPGVELSRCRFPASDLRDADLRGAHCDDVDFSGADLRDSDLEGSSLNGSRFHEAQLSGAHLRSVSGEGIRFDAAKLGGVDLSGASLVGASFVGAQLRAVRADGADLSRSDFTRADLSFASLRGATMTAADLSFALVEGADLSDANLEDSCLFRVDTGRARLTRTRLDRIDTTTDKRRTRMGS